MLPDVVPPRSRRFLAAEPPKARSRPRKRVSRAPAMERSLRLSFDLNALGWSPSRETEFELYAADALPARVAAQHRGAYVVYAACGERPAEIAGRLRHAAVSPVDLPAVGDWVAVADGPNASAATIHAVLERDTVFLRKAAGDEASSRWSRPTSMSSSS